MGRGRGWICREDLCLFVHTPRPALAQNAHTDGREEGRRASACGKTDDRGCMGTMRRAAGQRKMSEEWESGPGTSERNGH